VQRSSAPQPNLLTTYLFSPWQANNGSCHLPEQSDKRYVMGCLSHIDGSNGVYHGYIRSLSLSMILLYLERKEKQYRGTSYCTQIVIQKVENKTGKEIVQSRSSSISVSCSQAESQHRSSVKTPANLVLSVPCHFSFG
jgi:hypothetical protein